MTTKPIPTTRPRYVPEGWTFAQGFAWGSAVWRQLAPDLIVNLCTRGCMAPETADSPCNLVVYRGPFAAGWKAEDGDAPTAPHGGDAWQDSIPFPTAAEAAEYGMRLAHPIGWREVDTTSDAEAGA